MDARRQAGDIGLTAKAITAEDRAHLLVDMLTVQKIRPYVPAELSEDTIIRLS